MRRFVRVVGGLALTFGVACGESHPPDRPSDDAGSSCEGPTGQPCEGPCGSGRVECVGGEPRCVGTLESAGTVCRSAVSACDLPETCDGRSVECPPDELSPEGEDCGLDGRCDAMGRCVPLCLEGVSCATGRACERGTVDCSAGVPRCVPGAGPLEAGTVCRGGSACDPREECDGTSLDCPANTLAASGTTCPGGLCDGEGVCVTGGPGGDPCSTGNPCERGVVDFSMGAPICVGAGPLPADTVCRTALTECDHEETCDGVALSCPADAVAPAGTPCTGGACDGLGFCEGP